MNKLTITYDNNQIIEVPKGTTYQEISQYSKYKDHVLGVKKNNILLSLNAYPTKNETIEFFDVNSVDGTKMYKAGLKFVFEVALKTLFKTAEIHYLHSVPGGMFGEIDYNKVLNEEDIDSIDVEMRNIIKQDLPFLKYNILKKEAISFYNQNQTFEKATNVKLCDDIVTIYKLKNYLNYFYVPLPASTKPLCEFTLKYLGDNHLIILYPSAQSKGVLPKYIPCDKITNTYYKGKSWLKRLKTPYVSDLNNLVSSNNIKGFMESCELEFIDQIKKACDEILKRPSLRFIMIAGPSSSGKTTTTRVLGAYLRSKGYDPICISTDDYFVERENTPKDENGNYDFECLEAIDIELFNQQLISLLKNEEIIMPTFNFVTGKKEYKGPKLKMQEHSIVLIEGLHCLNDKLTPFIAPEAKYKIYLSPFIPLNIDRHNYISTRDLRLIRRIIRDNRTRGNSIVTTLQNWQKVCQGEEKYIFPYANEADIIINTALPYELGVLRVFAEPLILSVDTNSLYYEVARRLNKFLRGFYPISSEYVNKNSILREFIGGNNND